MYTPQWDKKNLNAALASWAELKHDAILYAKQPMGAECGGGGPEEPICMGYVEPNVKFWQKALDLLNETQDVFSKFDLSTEDTSSPAHPSPPIIIKRPTRSPSSCPSTMPYPTMS